MTAALTAYRFCSDPGHAWLEVTVTEIKRLGIKPSAYSYHDSGLAYLEEDCDAALFVEAKKKLGEACKFIPFHEENTPIRSYARFP